jgi:hypothetical protein
MDKTPSAYPENPRGMIGTSSLGWIIKHNRPIPCGDRPDLIWGADRRRKDPPRSAGGMNRAAPAPRIQRQESGIMK